jgi:hypothetical protein
MQRHFSNTLRLMLSIFVLCLGSGLVVVAQDTTGTLVGTVKDASGAMVPGATITITDVEKGVVVRTTTTADDGTFSIPLLPVAVYDVSIEAPNFKKHIEKDVKLDVNQRRSLEVALEAGNIAEVVTVAADAVTIELTTPTSSTLINGDQVRELSINNRNFVQLVTLSPGVSNDLSDQVYVGTVNPEGQPNTVQIAVNGGRATQNTFLVDGADITDRGSNLTIQAYPSVDSIGEFKVLRSLFPAESGSSGGGQVNIVTRSGGNEFHGSLFEFVRNEVFNANDFFTNQNASAGIDEDGKAKRRPFRYNNFGGTIGGPVYFFNFGEGNGSMFSRLSRTFFFFSEEQRRDLRYPNLSSTVPNANLRQGIFPFPVCMNRAYLGETCTGANILPANTPMPAERINPTSLAYLTNIYNRVPLPQNPITGSLIFPTKGIADFRQEIFKLDTSLSDDVSLSYRFQKDKIPTVDANALFTSGSGIPEVSTTESESPGKTHTVQGTYILNPNTIIEGRYAYAYGAILSHNVGLLALENSSIPVGLPYENERDRVPTITGNGFSSLQSFGPYDNFSNKNNFSGSLSMVRGSHSYKFGAAYSRYRKSENALPGVVNEGTFGSFAATLPSGVVLPPGISTTVGGNYQRWANFLVGNVPSFSQTRFDYTADFRQQNLEAYGQDEWRVRPNLTLYLGVRYSYFGQPLDANQRLSNFYPELYNAQDAPVVTGAGNRLTGNNEFGRPANWCTGMVINVPQNPTISIPAGFPCTLTPSPYGSGVVNVPKLDFAPRFGLAWDPFGKGRTSIRTGYGIYHEQFANGGFLNIIVRNQPIQETASATNTRIDQPIPPGPPTLAAFAATSQVRAVQRDWHTPYVQHWSLDLQHQLTNDTVVTVGYYGSRGVHLTGIVDINLLPPGTARTRTCARGSQSILTAGATLVQCQPNGYAFRNSTITAAAGNPNVAPGSTPSTDILILDQIRPYRGYRAINMVQPRFDSNYHSLQVFGQHRFGGASQVNVAYTWSKNLTNSQSDASAPQNPYNLRDDYGRAALDRKHVFSANFVYELPFFKSQEGFIGKLLGGWQASGIITLNSGLPLTATVSNYDPAGIGFLGPSGSGPRANQIGDPNTGGAQNQVQWFNTAAFEPVPLCTTTACPIVSNTLGSAGRGTINGPPTKRVDFTMTKNISFTESIRLQLRAEAFNVFNHTNFRAVSTNVTLSTYGNVTTVRDPRILQLGAKFIF